jgi:predicted dehydrogenase
MTKRSTVSRRTFLGSAGMAATTITIVPRHAVAGSGARSPNEKLNVAGIGVGGMGGADVDGVAGCGENFVAMADVDWGYAGPTLKRHPKAKAFQDFRKMFDKMESKIDAVVVGTPDHAHAVASMAAIRRKKHVYCEKPLAHSFHEVHMLTAAAKQYDVVTQLGNQGHSFDTIRIFCEWIADGAIGKVHTIHCGCEAVNSGIGNLGQLRRKNPVPATLDWDLFLGPTLDRPYCPAYHHGQWRGWMPFGNGTVGDWMCHVVDPVFWALDLGAPTSILAKVKDEGYDYQKQPDAFPTGEKITFEFAAKGNRGPITMHWYSGTEPIPQPEMLEPDRKGVKTGAVVLGDKGAIMYGSHGAGGVRIIPEKDMQAYSGRRPKPTLPRVRGHYQDWLDAIRNGKKAGSDFSYGGPLTEIAMLGVIGIKMSGRKLEWDAEKLRFTNCEEANQYVNPPCRKGWELEL